jgi:hypothetical protein
MEEASGARLAKERGGCLKVFENSFCPVRALSASIRVNLLTKRFTFAAFYEISGVCTIIPLFIGRSKLTIYPF